MDAGDWASWVSAIATTGTLIVALCLMYQQYTSLTKTTEALTDEIQFRKEEREEQERARVRDVTVERIGQVPGEDAEPLWEVASKRSASPQAPTAAFRVTNHTAGPIRDVRCIIESLESDCHTFGRGASGYAHQGVGVRMAIPRDEETRFYWYGREFEPDAPMEMVFTDHEGVRWRLNTSHGLSKDSRA
jgi:hypothetical protein